MAAIVIGSRWTSAADHTAAPPGQRREQAPALLGVGDALGVREVGAGGEGVARAGNDQGADLAVVTDLVQQALEFEHDLLVERVALLGPVKRKGGDAPVLFK